MLKRWNKSSEWMQYSLCWADPRFTADRLAAKDLAAVSEICGNCPVRVECAEWAISRKVTGVVAAGIHIPDPGNGVDEHVNKAARRFAYSRLRKWLKEQRGKDAPEV